jgi:hypothetical protein
MARSTTPSHRIVSSQVSAVDGVAIGMTSVAWRSHYGRVSQKSLARYVAQLEQSTQAGGCNAHLGAITVVEARVIRQSTNSVEAHYQREAR